MLSVAVLRNVPLMSRRIPDEFRKNFSSGLLSRLGNRAAGIGDAGSCLAYGLLLRQLVAEGFTDRCQPVIDINETGRPFIGNLPNVHVSISHTEGWVACALASKPVGIDIEAELGVAAVSYQGAIAPLLSAEERDWLASCSPGSAARNLVLLWTRKEAYLKAMGKGLPGAMDRFSSIPPETGEPCVPVLDPGRQGPAGWLWSDSTSLAGALFSVCLLSDACPEAPSVSIVDATPETCGSVFW